MKSPDSLFIKLVIHEQGSKIIILVMLAFANTISKIALSYTMGWFVNFAIDKKLTMVVFCGFGSVVSLTFIYILTVSSTRIQLDIIRNATLNLKKTAYSVLLSRRPSPFLNSEKDQQLSIIENTIPTIGQDYFLGLLSNVAFSIQILFCSIALIFVNLDIFLFCFAISSIPVLINPKIRRGFGKYKSDLNDAAENQMTALGNFLNGLETIRAFSAGNIFEKRTWKAEELLESQKKKAGVWDTRIVQLSMLLGMSAQIICMLVAALYILYGKITVGDLTITTQLLNYIFPAINSFNAFHLRANATLPLRKKIGTMFREANSNFFVNSFTNGDIHVRNVSFAYPDSQPIFSNFSADFRQGKASLIVGKSGKGKSTLLKIIAGYLDPHSGSVSFGDQNISTIDRGDLQKNVIYVNQSPVLFNGTVRENISLFGTNDLSSIQSELQVLGLIPLLDRSVTYSGSEISGGEKVRISLARAIAANPAIILLDEPDSGQDKATAQNIENVVLQLPNQTVIVVSHVWNEQSISQFDKVIHLQS